MSKSNINFSNFLSFSRILFVVPAVYFIANHQNDYMIILAIIGGFTDYFDGFFARKLNQVSDLGKLLDPAADKVLIAGMVISLSVYQDFPVWLTAFIVGRDILIVLGAIFLYEKVNHVSHSNWTGKVGVTVIATPLLFFLMGYKELFDYSQIFIILAIAISIVMYIKVFISTLTKK